MLNSEIKSRVDAIMADAKKNVDAKDHRLLDYAGDLIANFLQNINDIAAKARRDS